MKKAEETLKKVLASRVVAIRKQRGLTLEQVRDRTGLSKGYLCEIEHGEKNPTLDVLALLAEALCVPASALLDPVSEYEA